MSSERKTHIRIKFTDFWPDFIPEKSFFYKRLALKYEIELSDKPEILFYSVYSTNHQKYNCTKILFTGENLRPDFKDCDFAFSFDYPITERNYRLPLYALYKDSDTLVKRELNFEEILNQKKKFCCFIVSNPDGQSRNEFYQELSKRRHVDSAGKLYNNTGFELIDKINFIKDFKFVIAFENSSHPGYVTEKIYEPFISNCIPIYWGSDLVTRDFNPKRFINCHNYKSFTEVIDYIEYLDNNDAAYLSMLKEPIFKNDEVNEFVNEEFIMKQLDKIVDFAQNKSLIQRLIEFRRLFKYYVTVVVRGLKLRRY
ncbi:glycosyltransferase family 10 domain-containing protein [Pedobacter sp. Leaf170]|uniref:glycosyltransferase family 10 domain-containing protein n=1 Tax=Pedobacter sp. Leaf170 TaxID=2876558 RepID=UPI001E4B9E3A|nr:glycosyltransferase family 10 [Pedobacter sp. Leaf170]